MPPGAIGWLTVVPELITVWKLQAQMVADIAGIHGSNSELSRVQMLYCLFRHTAAQAARVVGGTFHSVAHRFVRRHAAALGLPAGFGVLDAGDAADLMDLVRQEAGLGQTGRRFPRKATLQSMRSGPASNSQSLMATREASLE